MKNKFKEELGLPGVARWVTFEEALDIMKREEYKAVINKLNKLVN